MKVIERKKSKEGYLVQIEDWSEDYPMLYNKNCTIAMFIPAKEDTPFVKKGELTRKEKYFNNEIETRIEFNKM